MTNPVADQHGYWTALAQQAVSGELRLEPELGEALRAAAKKYAERLTQAKRDTKDLERLSGWGTLPSAVAIRKKFEAKAAAGGAHDPTDSAAHRLPDGGGEGPLLRAPGSVRPRCHPARRRGRSSGASIGRRCCG
ncbi:hypothetical protein [Nocardia sp. CNY236]|uniref:hypothetical protein n=1 Tax=Nocardia sp. CNY236 TaxID=1169152 RepID=UPI00040F6A26|nr:hypothetical protein [Nocardia sp. CNY236]